VHVNSWRVRSSQIMLALLFGAISLLYATVGQAGGTSFLALMAFASFSPSVMRPTALMLNIVASAYSTWLFNRGKFVDWAKRRVGPGNCTPGPSQVGSETGAPV
jgi:uncharacterized membrane protein YfcA